MSLVSTANALEENWYRTQISKSEPSMRMLSMLWFPPILLLPALYFAGFATGAIITSMLAYGTFFIYSVICSNVWQNWLNHKEKTRRPVVVLLFLGHLGLLLLLVSVSFEFLALVATDYLAPGIANSVKMGVLASFLGIGIVSLSAAPWLSPRIFTTVFPERHVRSSSKAKWMVPVGTSAGIGLLIARLFLSNQPFPLISFAGMLGGGLFLFLSILIWYQWGILILAKFIQH